MIQDVKNKAAMPIVCDVCNKKFFLDDVHVKEQPVKSLPKDYLIPIASYFECPHCGSKYLINVTDVDLRNKLKIFRAKRSQYLLACQKKMNVKHITKLYNELTDMQQAIKTKQISLKEAVLDAEKEFRNERVQGAAKQPEQTKAAKANS